MHLGKALLGIAAATLTTGGLYTAAAFVEAPQNSQLEVPLAYPEFDPTQVGTSRLAAAKAGIEDAVSARLGGSWQVPLMNTYSETPRYVLGTGVELGVDVSTDVSAEAAARSVVISNPEVFGSASNDLELWDVRRGAGKVAVHFQQTYEGLEVWGARAHVTMTDAARAYAFKSNIFDGIAVDTTPGIGEGRAVDIAKAGVPFDQTTDRIDGEPQLIILPMGVSPVDVEHRLVWKVRVETADPVGIWVTHVDARTGDVLWRWNDVHFLDVSGSAESDVQPVTYCDGSVVEPSPYLDIDVSGLGTVTTDSGGNWFAGDGSGPIGITADLYGPYCNITNQGGPEAAFSGTATAGTPFTLAWDDTNSRPDERTVFDSVNDVHDFIELFDPGYSYSNTRIVGNVNRSQTCNAYWNGSINFYNAGGGCANTGEIAGVVHHEFGHGVQDDLIGFQGNEGLGEGNSDILSCLITGESIIGRGFNLGNCTSGIRDCNNNRQYPGSLTGQVHNDGQIIAGFNWDFMEAMKAQYGEETGNVESGRIWHFARKLETPTIQPDQVIAYFIVDDDDGDLGNGTPNFDAICDAATAHDFEEYCPTITDYVLITHTPLNDTIDSVNPYTVFAVIQGINETVDPSQCLVTYRVNGGSFSSVTMTNTGGAGYEAEIPAQPQDTYIDYYITAAGLGGATDSDPDNSPNELHTFVVGNLVTVFDDDMETDNGWTDNPGGGDTAIAGFWVLDNPNGTTDGTEPANPEDDATGGTGVRCWFTGQGTPGGSPFAADVDGGCVSIDSPTFALGGYSYARLTFRAWFYNSVADNDELTLSMSTDGGSTFTEVWDLDGVANNWNVVRLDLRDVDVALGPNTVFRFTTCDEGVSAIVEAAIDDFLVQRIGGAAVDVEDASSPAAFALSQNHPNPFNPLTTFSYDVPTASDVTVRIYNVAGRLVRTLVDGSRVAAGTYSARWDGTDATGAAVASGTYYYEVQAGANVQKRKMTLLK